MLEGESKCQLSQLTNIQVRPVSKKTKAGYLQVGCELYGGGLWHTWFDRDLSVAGRVVVSQRGGGFASKLVKIDRPILRVPTLAIHLDRTANDQFKFNKETEFLPILGLVNETLNATAAASRPGTPSGAATPKEKGDNFNRAGATSVEEKHHPLLLAVLADELGCNIDDINDFELCLYDTQPSAVGGLNNEFIFSPRCDNLMTCFASIEGICNAVEAEAATGKASEEENIRCVILFDNEEVGSVSNHGAESNLLPSFVEKVSGMTKRGYYQVLANSFLISADMGHAVHPNYEARYEANLAPRMNQGVVIKTNANQRYTSNAQTTFLLRRIAQRAGVPVQDFEVRNDCSCGSTVGPHLSTHVRTVDIGLAQLSMHSIRETAGSGDVKHYIQLFKTYFEVFSQVDAELKVDEF